MPELSADEQIAAAQKKVNEATRILQDLIKAKERATNAEIMPADQDKIVVPKDIKDDYDYDKASQVNDLIALIARKDAEINSLKEKIGFLNEALGDNGIQEENGGKAEDMLELIMKEMQSIKDIISVENASLIKENVALQDRMIDKQEKLEHITQTCQEDRSRKDKVKLINKYIYQMDVIRKTLYEYPALRENMSDADAANYLEIQLQEVVKGMDASLMQEMVERLEQSKNGDVVNPELQETIGIVVTDNPALDGKVSYSVSPAYVWRLPYILKAKLSDKGDEIKSYRFLIRPEQIITYKINK